MKQFILYCAFIISLTYSYHTLAQSCCVKPPAGNMQALALDKDFKAAHQPPIPFQFIPQAGAEDIHFPTPDGKKGNAFYVPSKQPTKKVLLVFHEWWGLNDYIKKEAEHWQELLGGDIDVYAPDLYDGKVATTQEQASKLMSAMSSARAMAIINGLLKKIGADKQVYTIGWCMGGSWSFAATLLAGKQAHGCVMYYGFPEKDPKKIAALHTNVLYIRGTKDKYISEADVKTFGQHVRSTGHSFEEYDFNADHAFANPSNPIYDKASTKKAEELALAFLKKQMK